MVTDARIDILGDAILRHGRELQKEPANIRQLFDLYNENNGSLIDCSS